MSFVPDGLIDQARKEGADAERRRIRREVAYVLVHIRRVAPELADFVNVLDRATKATRGRAPEGKR